MIKKVLIILFYAVSVILIIFADWEDVTSCNMPGIVADLFLIVAGLFGVIKLCYPTILKLVKAQKTLRGAILLLLFVFSISGLIIYYHRRLSHLVDADGNPNVGNMLMVAIPVILFLIIGLLQLKIRNMQRLVQLHNALDKIELLKRSLAEASAPAQQEVETNADQLRGRLRNELDNLPEAAPEFRSRYYHRALMSVCKRCCTMMHYSLTTAKYGASWKQPSPIAHPSLQHACDCSHTDA